MALTGLEVIEVVGGRDLHRAGAEFPVHEFWISDDGNVTLGQGQFDARGIRILAARFPRAQALLGHAIPRISAARRQDLDEAE